jgi:hypothetical protein
MFYLNVGHRWNIAEALDDVRAAIFPASSAYSERLRRAELPDFRRVALDPQLYLAQLDAEKCKRACAKLSSYPWFCVNDAPEFDSSAQNRTEWQRSLEACVEESWPCSLPTDEEQIANACRSAIEMQVDLGCSHIILPSPLISEREDEADTQAIWLDAGLKEAAEGDVSQPILATIAVDESTLNAAAFNASGFLDTIADQVSSRENLAGVYIVVMQTAARHPFETSPLVVRAYLHLCREFSTQNYDFIIPNFADVAGYMCMAVGATTFATGPSQSLRRLSAAAFEDSGGFALPFLYSHRVAAELATETDLDKLQARKMLSRVRDITVYSEPLFHALAAGATAATLPAWAEGRNNITTAQKHFIERMIDVERRMRRVSASDRPDDVREWLETAAANQLYISTRLGTRDEALQGRVIPADDWLEVFDAEVE